MTNFRTMIPESINTINYINSVFTDLGFCFILLSSSNSDKLNCTVIEIPFSLKDWGQIDLYNSNDILFNEDLITIDAEFNDDSEPKYDEYKKGVSAINYFVHNIIRKMRPCLTLLWSSTVPQSVLFKNIFDSYFIPTFYIERGLLPETLMMDIGGYGPFSSMQMQTKYEITTQPDIYEKVKDYYLSKKIEKHEQGNSLTSISIREQFNANDKKLIIFIGQWDVAAGVNSTNNIQSYINSPVFGSTISMFEALKEEISKQENMVLVFKPHPFDVNTYHQDSSKGIYVEKNVNLHSLFESADAIVGSSTTALNEALLYEKPVILMGHCMLSGRGACYEVQSLQELRNVLHDAIQNNNFKEKLIDILKYINYISYNYLLSINAANPLPNSFANRIKKFTSQYHLDRLNYVSVDCSTDLVKEQNSLLLSHALDTSRNKLDKAEVLIAENQLDLAEDILKELLALEPNNIDALNDISVVYVLKTNFIDARRAINKILILDPNNEVAIENMDYVMQTESEKTVKTKEQNYNYCTDQVIAKYNLDKNYQNAIGGDDLIKLVKI